MMTIMPDESNMWSSIYMNGMGFLLQQSFILDVEKLHLHSSMDRLI